MNTFGAVLFCVVAMALAANAEYYGHEDHHHQDYYAPAHYSYEYKVHDPHTGDVKSAQESRQGDQVKGSYSLNEPDGTIREVHYTADHHNGFNAVVQRHGHPIYPAQHSYEHHPVSHYNYGGHHGATSHQSISYGGHHGASSHQSVNYHHY